MSAEALKETPIEVVRAADRAKSLGVSVPHRLVVDNPRRVLVDRVVLEVAQAFHCREDEIRGRSRLASIAFARHIVYYLLWRIFSWSSTETGQVFGVNHTSVLYGRKHVAEIIGTDLARGEDVERVVTSLLVWSRGGRSDP